MKVNRVSSIAQTGAKRNRNLKYAYENGHLTVQEVINGATITRLTTDFGEHLRELYRRYGYDVNAKRLKEIERVILARYAGPVNTDDGHVYLSAAMNARALSWRHRRWKLAPGILVAWARRWTPLVPQADVLKLAQRVSAGPRRLKGATVGQWMKVSAQEKADLGLTTIDPCEVDPETLKREKEDARRDADRDRKASERKAKGATPRSESFRALCRQYGLTAWQERTLRKFRGRKGEVEAYLGRIDLDTAAHHLFVHLLVITNTYSREDTSNHADEKVRLEPNGNEHHAVEAGFKQGTGTQASSGYGDDTANPKHQGHVPAARPHREQRAQLEATHARRSGAASLSQRTGGGERGANHSGSIEPQRSMEEEDTMIGQDAARAAPSAAMRGPAACSLNPEPSESHDASQVDGSEHGVGASPEEPRAATPMSLSDSLIEIDRQLCDPDIADDWRQELLGMRRELSTAAARAVLEREGIADAA